MAKPATNRTQGQIMADIADGNLDSAISAADGTYTALGNLSGEAAANAQGLLDRAIRALTEAKAVARIAFENELR